MSIKKQLFILLYLVCPLICSSQTTTNNQLSAMGIFMGDSIDAVAASLLEKGYKPVFKNGGARWLEARNRWRFYCQNAKFWKIDNVSVSILSYPNTKAISEISITKLDTSFRDELLSVLDEKYGTHKTKIENFESNEEVKKNINEYHYIWDVAEGRVELVYRGKIGVWEESLSINYYSKSEVELKDKIEKKMNSDL